MNPPGDRIETAVPCALCGSKDTEPFFAAPDPLKPDGETFHLVRCPKDGLVFVSPRPGPEEIARHYPTAYAPHESAWAVSPRPFKSLSDAERRALDRVLGYRSESPGPWDGLRAARLRRKLRMHACFLLPFRSGGRLLEIGCGLGGLLGFYKERGWTVFGVEPSPAARRQATGRGLTVVPALEDLRVPSGSLDAVVFRHSLEHVHDPLATLRAVRPLLRPDGLVVIDVPNIASDGFRRFGRHWQPLEPPRHLYHFSVETLTAVVIAARFRVVDVLHSPATDALKGSLDHLLADAGEPHPFWHRVLRRSRTLLKSWTRFQALLGRSDTFVLTARPNGGV
ncbi:MAG: class I SAM-dependent methyltransferase [Myxococcales bacterium]|nr:class I SAM-dependent methyltransferase [Myxococcales bacterium]